MFRLIAAVIGAGILGSCATFQGKELSQEEKEYYYVEDDVRYNKMIAHFKKNDKVYSKFSREAKNLPSLEIKKKELKGPVKTLGHKMLPNNHGKEVLGFSWQLTDSKDNVVSCYIYQNYAAETHILSQFVNSWSDKEGFSSEVLKYSPGVYKGRLFLWAEFLYFKDNVVGHIKYAITRINGRSMACMNDVLGYRHTFRKAIETIVDNASNGIVKSKLYQASILDSQSNVKIPIGYYEIENLGDKESKLTRFIFQNMIFNGKGTKEPLASARATYEDSLYDASNNIISYAIKNIDQKYEVSSFLNVKKDPLGEFGVQYKQEDKEPSTTAFAVPASGWKFYDWEKHIYEKFKDKLPNDEIIKLEIAPSIKQPGGLGVMEMQLIKHDKKNFVVRTFRSNMDKEDTLYTYEVGQSFPVNIKFGKNLQFFFKELK